MGNIGGIAGHMAAGYIENCRAYGLFLANPESYDEGNLVNSSMLCQIGGIVGGMGAAQEKDGCLVRYCETTCRSTATPSPTEILPPAATPSAALWAAAASARRGSA